MSRVIDAHRQFIQDANRTEPLRRAVEATVRPGDVVIDLGCGTGLLGMMACRAGAARVYAIDAEDVIDVARRVARRNGFGDRIVFVKEYSGRVTLPERADVLVGDQVGGFGFDAGLLDSYPDVRDRLLKPDARIVPRRVEQWIALVDSPPLHARVEFWGGRPAGFDFAPARTIAANTGYRVAFEPGELLSDPVCGATFDLSTATADAFAFTTELIAARDGTLHGIAGWFRAELSPDIWMTNAPLDPHRICRRSIFLPIDAPVAVAAGDRVRAAVHIRPTAALVRWDVEIVRTGRRFSHTTIRGMLLPRETLERTRPVFVPHLTPRGAARRSVLELCDGRRPLAAIEREVYERHIELFPSFGDAQEFVAEVVTRYCV